MPSFPLDPQPIADLDQLPDVVLLRLPDGRQLEVPKRDYARVRQLAQCWGQSVEDWLMAHLPQHGAMPVWAVEILEQWAESE